MPTCLSDGKVAGGLPSGDPCPGGFGTETKKAKIDWLVL